MRVPTPRTPRRDIPGGVRGQLAVPMLVVVVCLMATLALAMIHIMRRQLIDLSDERARSLAYLIGQELHDSPPEESMGRLLRLRRHTGLALIAWRSADGWMVSVDDDVLGRAVEGRRAHLMGGLQRSVTIHTRTTSYQVSALALPGAEPVIVATSLEPLQDRLRRASDTVWVFILINGILALVLGYAGFTFVVVRPLRAIGVATDRAASGDFASPITALPRNEFGQVGRSFNAMLASLERHGAELQARIQELERINLELQHTQQSLLRSEKLASVGQLAAGVAHEVGNPLQGILGYAELLDDADLDDDMRAMLVGKIERQVERISTIIHELLDFSRDDSQQPLQPTDLARCVHDAVELARATRRVKHLCIELHDLDRLPPVEAVDSQVSQVLINLLFNAGDALDGQPDARVDLRAEATDEAVTLTFEDNGPGIPPEALARIFDPFYTTKAPGEGTGLGLSICARIMERFGGDMRVDAGEGGGARFTLTFRRSVCHHPSDDLS